MGHLEKLNISNRVIVAARPRHRRDTVEYRREKLVASIEEQIELATLALEDKPLQLKRKRGHSVVPVRPRLWWKEVPEGHLYTQIFYNKIPLKLARRGTAIEVDSLKKLPAVYRRVIQVVKAGELDKAVEAASRKSRP
ncbi:MAG: hypothetical protein O3B08_13570 [Proteobacteria bacterium]|nr:hypothetical protein [Pseudomonadota bacterium]